jgi:hypothetical protein
MRTVSDKEFEAVVQLPPPQGYEYLVERVADREELRSLKGAEGWVTAGEDQGRERRGEPRPEWGGAGRHERVRWHRAIFGVLHMAPDVLRRRRYPRDHH